MDTHIQVKYSTQIIHIVMRIRNAIIQLLQPCAASYSKDFNLSQLAQTFLDSCRHTSVHFSNFIDVIWISYILFTTSSYLVLSHNPNYDLREWILRSLPLSCRCFGIIRSVLLLHSTTSSVGWILISCLSQAFKETKWRVCDSIWNFMYEFCQVKCQVPCQCLHSHAVIVLYLCRWEYLHFHSVAGL